MEASRSFIQPAPRSSPFHSRSEGSSVREQSSMRWEWAPSPAYLWWPPSSAPKRATELVVWGVGWGGQWTMGTNNPEKSIILCAVILGAEWEPSRPFLCLIVSSVFSSQWHSSCSIQPLSTGSRGQQVQYIKKKEEGRVGGWLPLSGVEDAEANGPKNLLQMWMLN